MTDLSDKKILVVEDDPDNAVILTELLSMYKTDIAISGQIALEKAEQYSPDLILLDIMMPEMDGFETARLLKDNPLTADIPIIFVTAKTDAKSFIEGFDVGGDDYIMKPYDPHVVLRTVKNRLEEGTIWE
jgi:putative two-component system response regulator